MLKRADSQISVQNNPDLSSEKFAKGKDGKDGHATIDDWLWIDRATKSGSKQRVRLTISEYRGKWGVNIRVWYKAKDVDEWRPTWKGVWLSPAEAKAIAEAIVAGMEYADEKEKAGESPF